MIAVITRLAALFRSEAPLPAVWAVLAETVPLFCPWCVSREEAWVYAEYDCYWCFGEWFCVARGLRLEACVVIEDGTSIASLQ